MTADRRTYNEYCPMAYALDILGERWTLLAVRNLVAGPQRYTDLLEGLPGIPTDILTARLKVLQRAGVILKRRLPPPAAAVTVYELTPLGRGLETVVSAFTDWGLQLLGERGVEETAQATWFMAGMKARSQPHAAVGLHETYQFNIDGQSFYFRIDDGSIKPFIGLAPEADLILTGDSATFASVGSRSLSPQDAFAAGRLKIEGDGAALLRCLNVLGVIKTPPVLP